MSVTSPAGPSQATVETIKQKARLLSIYSMMSTTAAGSGHPDILYVRRTSSWPEYFSTP